MHYLHRLCVCQMYIYSIQYSSLNELIGMNECYQYINTTFKYVRMYVYSIMYVLV